MYSHSFKTLLENRKAVLRKTHSNEVLTRYNKILFHGIASSSSQKRHIWLSWITD